MDIKEIQKMGNRGLVITYQNLIRIDEDNFVLNKSLDFDLREEIFILEHEIMNRMSKGEAIKDYTSFTSN